MMDAWLLVVLVVLALAYGLIVEFESKEDWVDPIIEKKCKKCFYYTVCKEHGRKYGCRDFDDKEDL